MTNLKAINEFMGQKNIAVAGVSRTKHKFGNTIFHELSKKGINVFPVNPNLDEFEGMKCYKGIESLPEDVTGIVINTKPAVTAILIKEAEARGIKNIWLQQGSADKKTIAENVNSPSNIIAGQCILMFNEPVKGMHGFHRWLKKSFGKFPN
jgi:predicted CoA-binding protein